MSGSYTDAATHQMCRLSEELRGYPVPGRLGVKCSIVSSLGAVPGAVPVENENDFSAF